MGRGDLTDRQWEQLAPHLPPEQTGKRGRPWCSHRRIINGILWVLRTGASWRDLPERYGPWQTVYTRFRRWTRAGVWDQVFAAVQRQADAAGQLDWTVHFIDGTVIRAHQHAAGAKGGTQRPKRSAAARGASPRRSISAPRAAAGP